MHLFIRLRHEDRCNIKSLDAVIINDELHLDFGEIHGHILLPISLHRLQLALEDMVQPNVGLSLPFLFLSFAVPASSLLQTVHLP